MPEATLIYNLFPPLLGPIPRWEEHLKRIAAMGFTWLYLNPIHTPGLSGSLYAVKDYFGLNPLFFPDSGKDPEAALEHFLKAAGRRGLKVMLDLVINHTAIDSPLVKEHPEWYAQDEDGQIKHPGAIDPADATRVTVWGDLAELEYWPPPDPEGLLNFWHTVVAKYLRLGFRGFRADAAYKIPGEFWERLISEARRLEPRARFFAETLGCRLEECAQLSSRGLRLPVQQLQMVGFPGRLVFAAVPALPAGGPLHQLPGDPRHPKAGGGERRRHGGGPATLSLRRLFLQRLDDAHGL